MSPNYNTDVIQPKQKKEQRNVPDATEQKAPWECALGPAGAHRAKVVAIGAIQGVADPWGHLTPTWCHSAQTFIGWFSPPHQH